MTLTPETLEIFSIASFIASICIVILLIIEANVLIRLLPLIKKSAENSSSIANTLGHGEEAINRIIPTFSKYSKDYLINCPEPNNPHHIHQKMCLP